MSVAPPFFAACGDFYHLIGTSIYRVHCCHRQPSIRKAAFRRVIGVTGVTANGTLKRKESVLAAFDPPAPGVVMVFQEEVMGADMQS